MSNNINNVSTDSSVGGGGGGGAGLAYLDDDENSPFRRPTSVADAFRQTARQLQNFGIDRVRIEGLSVTAGGDADTRDGRPVRAISELQFMREYVFHSRPCIIVGAMEEWPAMRRWRDDAYLFGLAPNGPATRAADASRTSTSSSSSSSEPSEHSGAGAFGVNMNELEEYGIVTADADDACNTDTKKKQRHKHGAARLDQGNSNAPLPEDEIISEDEEEEAREEGEYSDRSSSQFNPYENSRSSSSSSEEDEEEEDDDEAAEDETDSKVDGREHHLPKHEKEIKITVALTPNGRADAVTFVLYDKQDVRDFIEEQNAKGNRLDDAMKKCIMRLLNSKSAERRKQPLPFHPYNERQTRKFTDAAGNEVSVPTAATSGTGSSRENSELVMEKIFMYAAEVKVTLPQLYRLLRQSVAHTDRYRQRTLARLNATYRALMAAGVEELRSYDLLPPPPQFIDMRAYKRRGNGNGQDPRNGRDGGDDDGDRLVIAYAQLQNNCLNTEYKFLKKDILTNIETFGTRVFGGKQYTDTYNNNNNSDGRSSSSSNSGNNSGRENGHGRRDDDDDDNGKSNVEGPEAANVWLGIPASVSSFHQDWVENLYGVVRGVKEFVLIPPWEGVLLPKPEIPSAAFGLAPVDQSQEGTSDSKKMKKKKKNKNKVATEMSAQGSEKNSKKVLDPLSAAEFLPFPLKDKSLMPWMDYDISTEALLNNTHFLSHYCDPHAKEGHDGEGGAGGSEPGPHQPKEALSAEQIKSICEEHRRTECECFAERLETLNYFYAYDNEQTTADGEAVALTALQESVLRNHPGALDAVYGGDSARPSAAASPKLPAEIHPLVAQVFPSEVLYLPAMWVHRVGQRADSIDGRRRQRRPHPQDEDPADAAGAAAAGGDGDSRFEEFVTYEDDSDGAEGEGRHDNNNSSSHSSATGHNAHTDSDDDAADGKRKVRKPKRRHAAAGAGAGSGDLQAGDEEDRLPLIAAVNYWYDMSFTNPAVVMLQQFGLLL